MQDVNKQLLDALKSLMEIHDNPAPFGGKTGEERMLALESQAAKRNAAIYSARQAIAAAEQAQQESLAPGYPRVDVGLGKFAIGAGICRVSNNPALMFLHLDEPRDIGANCADVYPVGVEAPKDRIAAAIHFHNAKAVQRVIDELLAIQREHYPEAEQAQQAEPVADAMIAFEAIKSARSAHAAGEISTDELRARLDAIFGEDAPQLAFPAAWLENSGWARVPLREQATTVAVPDGYALVPLGFLQAFHALAHNYSLQAQAPDHYAGTERDAFSDAYARCGSELVKLRAMLAAQATNEEQQK